MTAKAYAASVLAVAAITLSLVHFQNGGFGSSRSDRIDEEGGEESSAANEQIEYIHVHKNTKTTFQVDENRSEVSGEGVISEGKGEQNSQSASPSLSPVDLTTTTNQLHTAPSQLNLSGTNAKGSGSSSSTHYEEKLTSARFQQFYSVEEGERGDDVVWFARDPFVVPEQAAEEVDQNLTKAQLRVALAFSKWLKFSKPQNNDKDADIAGSDNSERLERFGLCLPPAKVTVVPAKFKSQQTGKIVERSFPVSRILATVFWGKQCPKPANETPLSPERDGTLIATLNPTGLASMFSNIRFHVLDGLSGNLEPIVDPRGNWQVDDTTCSFRQRFVSVVFPPPEKFVYGPIELRSEPPVMPYVKPREIKKIHDLSPKAPASRKAKRTLATLMHQLQRKILPPLQNASARGTYIDHTIVDEAPFTWPMPIYNDTFSSERGGPEPWLPGGTVSHTEIQESRCSCFYNVTAIVIPLNVHFSVLASNPGHLLYKMVSAVGLVRRFRLRPTGLNPDKVVIVFAVPQHSLHNLMNDQIMYLPLQEYFASQPLRLVNQVVSSFAVGTFAVLTRGMGQQFHSWWVYSQKKALEQIRSNGVGMFCAARAIVGFDRVFHGQAPMTTRELALARGFRAVLDEALFSGQGIVRGIDKKRPWWSVEHEEDVWLEEPIPLSRVINITVVSRSMDRATGRHIIDVLGLVNHAREVFKDESVNIQVIGMGKLNATEQLKVAATSDIYIGAHGAGLTWGYGMPPGRVIVEMTAATCFRGVIGNSGAVLNGNCQMMFASMAAMFRLHHLHYHYQERSKGHRTSNILVSPDSFVSIIRYTLCIVRLRKLPTEEGMRQIVEKCGSPELIFPVPIAAGFQNKIQFYAGQGCYNRTSPSPLAAVSVDNKISPGSRAKNDIPPDLEQ